MNFTTALSVPLLFSPSRSLLRSSLLALFSSALPRTMPPESTSVPSDADIAFMRLALVEVRAFLQSSTARERERKRERRRCSLFFSCSKILNLSSSSSCSPLRSKTQATAALERQEVPIGCVLVDESGRVVAKGSNRTNEKRDVSLYFFCFLAASPSLSPPLSRSQPRN